MQTNGSFLRAQADRKGIPLRTLADVRNTLERCKHYNADAATARLMLKHGRLTDEARAWVALEYPQ